MKKKDLIIGLSLIIIVGVSGGVSLLFILNQQGQGEEKLLRGLPENWDTAPSSAFFTLKTNTETINVTLASILEGIQLAIEEAQDPSGANINEYKDVIYYYTFYHQALASYITGVDLLDILEKFGINFAYNMTIESWEGEIVSITSGEIIKKMYEGAEDPLVIAIAANKMWLANSSLGEEYGNFSLLGKNWNIVLKNIKKIEIISNWTVSVEVNGNIEYTIDPMNMMENEFTANYSYHRSDWWNYDRQYWGRNISEIISHTNASGQNYTVRFYAIDEVVSPALLFRPYNRTDVELGIVPPWISDDKINGSQYEDPVPMLTSPLLMNLVYKDREFGETGFGTTDPVWPYARYCGYHRGPFYLIVPGRPRAAYIKYVYKISISYN
jgi:hypothetical protein